MKNYPALDIASNSTDLLLATLDDLAPTAIEERDDAIRAFFSSAAARDRAQSALAPHFPVAPIEVSDEDWARRSQENLQPVTVGRLTVTPNPPSPIPNPQSLIPNPFSITITPSMGFGTGHHATTRLCLAALQTVDLAGAFVLDIGTGSGVLAIAAAQLGALQALGLDHDPDAVQSATENLALNPAVRGVTFAVDDLRTAMLPPADVVTANLTGALLIAAAPALLQALRRGGTLIASGLLISERDDVVRALEAATVVWEQEEDGWVGLAVKKA